MKKILTIVCLLCTINTWAQQLTVTDFHMDDRDNAAIKFEKKDANKESCALIIVQIALAGVTFEGDVVAVEQKDGDYWVYMTNGATWLEVKAKGYLSPELDIRSKFPDGLTKLMTYRLTIEKPVGADNEPQGTLEVSTNAAEADFYVDGVKQISGRSPFKYSGSEGMHRITIKAAGYNEESVDIEIKLGRTQKHTVNLKAEGSFSLNGISYEMVSIEKGSFMMGSKESLNKYSTFSMDKPAHQVTLRSFSIGKTEVPQALWQAVMGSNPSINQGANKPVENVSWDDCQEFIQRLNEQCGTHFRLPTEAEWEYAASCRDGNLSDSFSGSSRLDAVANTGTSTADCGSKQPSAIGMQDMTGNVAEWCQDYYARYNSQNATNPSGPSTGLQRVVRGGSYADRGDVLRNSHRGHMRQEDSSPTVGLRLAQDN